MPSYISSIRYYWSFPKFWPNYFDYKNTYEKKIDRQAWLMALRAFERKAEITQVFEIYIYIYNFFCHSIGAFRKPMLSESESVRISLTISPPSGLRSGLTIDWNETNVFMSYSKQCLISILAVGTVTDSDLVWGIEFFLNKWNSSWKLETVIE